MTELHELLKELQNSSPVKYKGQEYCDIIEEIDRRLKMFDKMFKVHEIKVKFYFDSRGEFFYEVNAISVVV